MGTYFLFIAESSLCIVFSFLAYILVFRKETGLKFLRYFLLIAIGLSVVLPFNRLSVKLFTVEPAAQGVFVQDSRKPNLNTGVSSVQKNETEVNSIQTESIKTFDYLRLLKSIYFAVMIAIICHFLTGIIIIYYWYLKSPKEQRGNVVVIKNEKLKNSFSFLHMIFLNPNGLSDDEIKSIIIHENIHVSQYHTIDLILIELLSAVMWFNPFVWLLRKSLRQVHEYLADEGVLNTGFDRLEYQALLINQVAEGRLLSLASSFNQSLIKNRIIMMTKLNSANSTKLKLLTLVPLTAILFFSIACVNGQNKNSSNSVVTAVAATKMNVLYIGIDNPIDISVSEQKPEDLEVKIDNGRIQGSNGNYIANPDKPGKAVISVFSKGTKVKETEFRVKNVPDPVAKVAGIKISGNIKKSDLLAQPGIYAELENFDFDLRFVIVGFTISTVDNGYFKNAVSQDDKFTTDQRNIMTKVQGGYKLYIEDIKAMGPDGTIRKLGNISLTLE